MRRLMILLVAVLAPLAGAQTKGWQDPAMDPTNWENLVSHHPAGEALMALFPMFPSGIKPTPEKFSPTGLTRKDYLALIAGNVDFWKQHQNEAGAIVDPYEKKERQYATPAFALASAILVSEAGRDDLLDHSIRAMSFSTAALANGTTADKHADFYIPMLMHARRILTKRAPEDVSKHWDEQFRGLVPQKTYRAAMPKGNWNLVNVSGECLRRKDGLVATTQQAAQGEYLDAMLKGQREAFSKFGMYEDPNVPLAYDAFPRLWLEDVMADGAYDGPEAQPIRNFLALGGLSSLLLLSPSGEWACGGRSAHHQWNEAQTAIICEVNAAKWKDKRPDVAGAFKRAAHLALSSMKRWQRPSGEMWIVKNRADPAKRFGYESYSFHSQYNLLAMAMLAMAYQRADDSIQEYPIPAEVGGYVFDLREKFHKIAAAAGGTYVLIDTSADPHYNGTGLQRVHKAGVALSPLSDSAAAERGFTPKDDPRAAMTPGIAWKIDGGDRWHSLAQFSVAHFDAKPPKSKPSTAPKAAENVVTRCELKVSEQSPQRVRFRVAYETSGEGAQTVQEDYILSAEGVEGRTMLMQGSSVSAARIVFPAFVNDGEKETQMKIDGSRLEIRRDGGALTWEVLAPQGLKLQFDGPRVPTHNGYVQAVHADLPRDEREVKWKITLQGN